MKTKTLIGAALLVVFSIFAIGSFAQKGSAQTDANNSSPSSATAGTMGQGGMMYGGTMYGGMMNGRMMYGRNMYGRGMMGRSMMEDYGAMHKMMNRLESDLSAAKSQAGSAAVQSRLADASTLVSKLRDEFSNSWGMMMRYMPMHGNTYCYWNQPGQQQTKR